MPRIIIAVVVCLTLSGLYPKLSGAAPEPLIQCEPEPTDMDIAIGDIVACAITPAGETDIFRFQGTAGTVILLALTDLSPGCGGFFDDSCPVAQLFCAGVVTPLLVVGPGSGKGQVEIPQTGSCTRQAPAQFSLVRTAITRRKTTESLWRDCFPLPRLPCLSVSVV